MSQTSLSDNVSTLSYNVHKSKLPIWLWNPQTRTVLGKSGSGWFKLLVFYAIFFASLIFFWAGMMSVFLYFILPVEYPMRTGTHSLLKFRPGLGMRPMVDHETTFIRFSVNDPQTYNRYIQSLDAFMDPYFYLSAKPKSDMAVCTKGKKIPDSPKKLCQFPISSLGPCQPSEFYGYKSKSPCVLIKMNRIYGWLPDVVDKKNPHPMVSCFGSNPLDKQNIGDLSYYPSETLNKTTYGYYDNSYFPYIGQPDYVSPLVAVQFKKLTPNVIVHVTCRLENIPGSDESSDIKFEIAMDL